MNFIFLVCWKVANPQILCLKFVSGYDMIYFEDKIVQNDEITSTSYFAYPDMSLLLCRKYGKEKNIFSYSIEAIGLNLFYFIFLQL